MRDAKYYVCSMGIIVKVSKEDIRVILLSMCIGVLIGNKFFPVKYKGINEKLQVVCTLILIFSMGVMLGRRENFIKEIASFGWTSFLFFLIPSIVSIGVVYLLTKRFFEKGSGKRGRE